MGVDYLAAMSLHDCNPDTVDAITKEWLDYATARILI